MYRFSLLLLIPFTCLCAMASADAPAERITRHDYNAPQTGATTPYLLYHPAKDAPVAERSLLIFLYGAGGSLESYNIARPPYALLREQLGARGFYIVVPDLGKAHFMNDVAIATLDGIVATILEEHPIPPTRVHVMGTSMGAGSSLAYAIQRPDLVRSVCAVMPMTDFARWVSENPRYAAPVAEAYGGAYGAAPEAYDRRSAIRNVTAFANIPVMLIHGDADDVVLYGHSKALAEALKAKHYPCAFYTAEGQGHKDDVMTEFQDEAVAFFESATKTP